MIKGFYHIFVKGLKDYRFYRMLNMQFPNCTFEQGFHIKGPIGNLQLGEKIEIQSNTLFHLGGMAWCDYKGFLKIGKNSIISPNVIIYAAGSKGVEIGDRFDCGPGVKIFSSYSSFEKRGSHVFEKVKIGNNVILFANVVVSPGVSIGDNSVILAGAVVNKDVPANAVYGGVPAKFIKTIKG